MPLFETITDEDSRYPALLKEVASPPKQLYVRGTLPPEGIPAIAVVGTRKATRSGRELAERTARELAEAGIAVISGLAMGIDTAAHTGALRGGGKTIAVLGCGINTVYPAQNERLARQIIETGGAVVSEYGPGAPSYKGNFIERNRIISGLALATLIIEAPERSGALTTARFAGEDGRSVFVFPGAAKDKHYTGSHALIRDGATLVTSVDEILEDLNIETSAAVHEILLEQFGPNEAAVLLAIKNAGEAQSVDRIIETTTLDSQAVSGALAALTIQGIIKETERGYELGHR